MNLSKASGRGRPGNRKFWENRVVLVTGATGFVGSSLTARLVALGAKVLGFSCRGEDEKNLNFFVWGLEKKVKLIRGAIEDFRFVRRIVRKHRFDIVYHLAAQAIVGKANLNPLPTFKTNIEGTWNLLEACREKRNRIKAIVVASSDKAYVPHKNLPYREDYPLQPNYPYDVSKACADIIARSFYRTYGLPIVVTRFANIYGPGDHNYSRIIPDVVQHVLRGRSPVIRSDGTPIRDYLYIEDAVDLYLLLAERIGRVSGEVFNAGCNHPISVLHLARMILKLAGRTDLKPEIRGKGKLPGEINKQWLDARKVNRVLHWKPKVNLEEGLRQVLLGTASRTVMSWSKKSF